MKISLNGFLLNDLTSKVYVNGEIDGLELPSIRSSTGNYAGRSGGYVGAQLFSPRDVTLTGTVFSSDLSAMEQARKDLETALASLDVTMRIVTNAGNAYVIYCNLLDFKMPINRDMFQADFKIELFAGDINIYDDSSGGALSVTVPREVSGGYTYPVVYPVVYAAGTGPTTVTNNGSVEIFPVLTLTGVMTNPVMANLTADELVAINPIVTAPGDVVVIDMRARTATLNGSNIFAKVSGDWWSLATGGNDISLTTSDGGDTVSAAVSWRNGRLGI